MKAIVTQVAISKEYQQICKKIARGNDLHKDLFQELLVVLLEYDPIKLELLNTKGQLKWFIIRILTNMYHSKTSPFYKIYKKENGRADENIDVAQLEISEDQYNNNIDHIINAVEDHLKKEQWYCRELFRLYLKEGTLRKVSAKTGIPLVSIHDSIKSLRQRICQNIKY